jgi:hypothetical protein
MLLLAPEDAIDFIHQGIKLDLRFLGVEGFRIIPTGAIQPLQEFSNGIDDCDITYEEFLDSTFRLIQGGISQGIIFDVVFDTNSEMNY